MTSIYLKEIKEQDLQHVWEISYGPSADLTWKEYDGPYFEDPLLSWEAFSTGFGKDSIDNPHRKLIMSDNQTVGMVTAYWEDGRLKQWLEIGLLIYDSHNWGKGIGHVALSLWIKELFQQHPALPHIGFTTWSGNIGMQKIGEKSGMTKEGVIRQVRFWQDCFYDSVKYGILRDEVMD